MAYWSASVSPRRSWAWRGYVFLKQLGSSHLSLGQVFLHPGMSGGRTFSLDLALLLLSLQERGAALKRVV